MAVVAVDAAVGQKPHEMKGLAVFFAVVHGTQQRRVPEEIALLDGLGDSGQLLVDNAPGANVGVPHLGVAHLAVWQTHIHARRPDVHMGPPGKKPVQVGGVGRLDGVAVFLGTVAKTVHNNQCDWFFHKFSPSGGFA